MGQVRSSGSTENQARPTHGTRPRPGHRGRKGVRSEGTPARGPLSPRPDQKPEAKCDKQHTLQTISETTPC
jgi:hypothetical protein